MTTGSTPMRSNLTVCCLLVAATILCAAHHPSEALAAGPASPVPASRASTPSPSGMRASEAPPPRPAAPQDVDAGSRSVAARARMNECGHQWNNMKHAGTASGTWKEFSRGCLAQR